MIDFYSSALPELEVKKEKPVEDTSKLFVLNHYQDRLKVDDGSGNFKIENLFSELKTEYQKAVARHNLGVEIDNDLVEEELEVDWANIIGDPVDSSLWPLLHELLKEKADLQSPVLEGYPTTPDPDDYCNKNQIANVRWTEKTADKISVDNINNLTPGIAEIISINKINELTPGIAREIAIELISEALENYTPPSSGGGDSSGGGSSGGGSNSGGGSDNTTPSTPVVYNYTYYGKSDDVSSMAKTTSSSFTITLDSTDYLYILVYNDDDASFSVNGFVGGFELVGSPVVIDSKQYYKYRSYYPGLGKITVSIL
jgi:hypothetical protein